MGKKGSTSWLTAVKRAFRSPTKDDDEKVCVSLNLKNSTFFLFLILLTTSLTGFFFFFKKQKREKRRWPFRKPANQETVTDQQTQQPKPTPDSTVAQANHESTATAAAAAEQKHALEVAVATAEAAMATAQAAVEVARLSRPANHAKQHNSAIVIQTAFRGYLVSQI